MMLRTLRNVARKVYFTTNTVRYDVEIPRIAEALSSLGRVGTLLDGGAGSGYYCAKLYSRVADRLIAVEYDKTNYAILETTLGPLRDRCTFLNASLTEIPVGDGTVDCVVCSQVMEHIDDDGKVVDEFRRVLKPGGHAIITVPLPPAPWPEAEHVREGYTLAELRRIFEDRSFEFLRDDYFLTKPTQDLILRIRPRPKGRMLRGFGWNPVELSMTREQRAAAGPYGILGMFRKA